MELYQGLFNNIRKFVQLNESEEKQLLNILKVKRIKRKQFIIQPGFPCYHRTYIVEGAFRVFHLDNSGKEHTVSIGIEDWFVTDFFSYINQSPATNFAEALEDSTIIQMHYQDIERLCKEIHKLSEYFRLTTEKAFAHSRRRAISNLSKTAEERYDEYVKKYPQIVNRVPQYILASYLGISPEFLSKIRKLKILKS